MEFYHLVDSLEQINLTMNNDFIFENLKDAVNFLKIKAENSLLAEICIFLGKTKNEKILCRKMQNRSKNPEIYFMIDPYEYLEFINDNKMIGVFHSHLIGDEKPSDFDIKMSENSCVAFLIYSINTEKFFIYEPQYKDYDVININRLKEIINEN